jgi:hypothetical protein
MIISKWTFKWRDGAWTGWGMDWMGHGLDGAWTGWGMDWMGHGLDGSGPGMGQAAGCCECGDICPFIVIIETISNLIRPGTLAVRLTANMIAGHLLLTSTVNIYC